MATNIDKALYQQPMGIDAAAMKEEPIEIEIIDPEVLAWGRANRVAGLNSEQRKRLRLLEANVLEADTGPVDIVGAFNFSYWIFKERATMLRYFRSVYESLVDDGIFFLDSFGGYEAF